MVTRSYIVSNLSSLSRSFTNAKNQRDSLFFSKLAILELCGWIEESMDDVVTRCSARRLKLQANIEHCEKQIVKRTYGFDYQEHFRSMLIRLLGLINVEKIESRVDQQKLQRMTAALTTKTSTKCRSAYPFEGHHAHDQCAIGDNYPIPTCI
jgi:hypothetical protein